MSGGPPAAAHASRDVSPRPILIAGLLLVLVLVLLGGGAALLLRHYAQREARRSPPASPLAARYGRQVPPEPRLQVDPEADLRELRAREEGLLDGYGWVDRQAGTVRIPIARAIDLLAERAARRSEGAPR